MPLYEYECTQCGHAFEVVQKAQAHPLKICPRCSGPLRKLLSAPAIQFKGSGWYITDYAKKTSASGEGSARKKDESSSSPEPKKDDSSPKT